MKHNGGVTPSAGYKALNSLVAGAIASGIANPFDLCLVRMQADMTLPEAQRRNYKNVADAFKTIVKTEGFLNLYRGCSPTVARAMSMNLSMLVTFDIVKDYLEANYSKGKLTVFLSTCVSGVFLSLASLPFDNMKTKLQKQTKGADGKYLYDGLRDCLKKTVQREGFFGLWTGLPTYYMRCAPHSMFTLIFAENLKYFFGINK